MFVRACNDSFLNPDGSFDIRYVNGKFEQRVTRYQIKLRNLVYGDMCKAQGCEKVVGGMCPAPESRKAQIKKSGYDCVMEGDVCESQRFCCMELM